MRLGILALIVGVFVAPVGNATGDGEQPASMQFEPDTLRLEPGERSSLALVVSNPTAESVNFTLTFSMDMVSSDGAFRMGSRAANVTLSVVDELVFVVGPGTTRRFELETAAKQDAPIGSRDQAYVWFGNSSDGPPVASLSVEVVSPQATTLSPVLLWVMLLATLTYVSRRRLEGVISLFALYHRTQLSQTQKGREVIDWVRANPGATVAELSRGLDLRRSSCVYRLNRLEAAIVQRKDGNEVRLYLRGAERDFSPREVTELDAIRIALANDDLGPRSLQRTLLTNRLDLPLSTIFRRLQALCERGEVVRVGKRYRLVASSDLSVPR